MSIAHDNLSSPASATGPPSDRHDAQTPPPSQLCSTGAPCLTKAAFGELHTLLGGALPRLWRYTLTRPDCASAKRQRRKLRELIAWVLFKQGYRIRNEVPTPFEQEGRLVRGRLELLIESATGEALLALETDWSDNEDSLRKLSVWWERGVPTLWVSGRSCKRDERYELRRLANRTLRQDTGVWLPIFHLEHGWLRLRASAAPTSQLNSDSSMNRMSQARAAVKDPSAPID